MAIDALIFRADPIRSVAFGSITGSYVSIGSVLSHSTRQLLITNSTNQLLMFSFQPNSSTPNHFVIPASTSIIIDITSNKSNEPGWFIEKRTQVAVKHLGSAPTSGSVYLSAFYGKGQ